MKNQKSTSTKNPETQKRSNPSTPKMAGAKRRSSRQSEERAIVGAHKPDTWEFYHDQSGKWRWKRTAPNGEIVGASTQGYVAKYDCVANAKRNGWKG